MIVPCYRGGHHCSWPACPTSCNGRKPAPMLPELFIETLVDLRRAIQVCPRIHVVAMIGDFTASVRVSKTAALRLCDDLASDGRTADEAGMAGFARVEHDMTLCIGGL